MQRSSWRTYCGENPAAVYLLGSALQTPKELELSKAISDTTAMPKAVAHPVDAKLILCSIECIVRAAKAVGIHLKRTFESSSKLITFIRVEVKNEPRSPKAFAGV